PLGDVGFGALVRGEEGDDLAHIGRLQGPNQLHQRAGTRAAPGVDFLVHHVLRHLLSPPEWLDSRAQMNRLTALSLASAMKPVTPCTPLPTSSRSSSFSPNRSMVMPQA